MDTPIYSNSAEALNDKVLSKRVIGLLSETKVYDFNNQITFIPHGIYIFPQYKEKTYIINGYPEDVFKSSITQTYILLHDCGYRMLQFLLEPVLKDGKEVIRPFLVTESAEKEIMEQTKNFIYDIESVRHYEQHIMKCDSEVDKMTERAYKKVIKKVINKEIPETQDEWDKCIYWIVKNCSAIENILNNRIKYIAEKATDFQKQILVENYYRCLEQYYEKVIVDVVETVYHKRHVKKNKAYYKSIAQEKKDELIKEAITLLKKSSNMIDPYKAIVQATDLYLK